MRIVARCALAVMIGSLGCQSHHTADSTRRDLASDSLRSGADTVASRDTSSAPSSMAGEDGAKGSAAAAAAVIRDYYAAIDAHDYRRAYAAWGRGGAASKQSFEAFQQGFDSTAAVTVQLGEPSRIEGAAGSRYVTIPVQITAHTVSGEIRRFRGTYDLRRAVVTGASPEQRAWHIYSAKIVAVE